MITMNTIHHNYPEYHDYHGRTMITMNTMGKENYGNLDKFPWIDFPWIDFHVAVTSRDNMTTMGDYHDYHANNGCYQDTPPSQNPRPLARSVRSCVGHPFDLFREPSAKTKFLPDFLAGRHKVGQANPKEKHPG